MKWAYGVTTVPERRYQYLPKTLESLRLAGFPTPTLFIDGSVGGFEEFGLPLVFRGNKILAYGNWLLALLELWIRYPNFDRYALFQDDFQTYPNLRPYLEKCVLNNNQYWNLLTFPQNEDLRPNKDYIGWYYSNQRGRGAVGIVFPHEVVHKVLTSPKMVAKPHATRNPHRSIDGCLVESCSVQGIREMVHYPTLVYHTGDCSSIGNVQHGKPVSFLGSDHNALNFLSQEVNHG